MLIDDIGEGVYLKLELLESNGFRIIEIRLNICTKLSYYTVKLR